MKQPWHDCQPMQRLVRMKPPDGARHRHATRFMLIPQLIKRHRELRRRHRRIMTKPLRQTHVIVAAFDPCIGITEVARNPRANPHTPPRLHQTRRLLDMQFHVRMHPRRLEEPFAALQSRGIAAALAHMLRQGPPGIDARRLQRTLRQRAQRGAAADIRHLKPDALLGTDPHHHHVARRSHTQPLQRAHGNEPPTTPAAPSKLPPCGTELRCEPTITGAAVRSRPGRIM